MVVQDFFLLITLGFQFWLTIKPLSPFFASPRNAKTSCLLPVNSPSVATEKRKRCTPHTLPSLLCFCLSRVFKFKVYFVLFPLLNLIGTRLARAVLWVEILALPCC